MKKIISLFSQSITAKGTFFLLVGSIFSQIVGFLVIALLTRNLAPDAFGLFITAFAFSQLLADLFELGINPALLAFASSKKGKELHDYVKTSLFLKSAVAFILLAVVFFGAPIIAKFIFNSNEIIPYIQLSAVGSSLLLFVVWGQTVFNIENKFFLSSFINSTTNIFRFFAIGILVLLHLISPVSSYFFFQVSIILSLILFFTFYGFKFFKAKYKTAIAKQLIIFGLPIGWGFSVGAIYTRLDQILVFNMLGSFEAGVYGLGYRLASVFVLGISAFGTVISPRFAAIPEDHYKDYFRKTFMVIGAMVGAALISILVSPFFIPLIFGNDYQNSISVFQILTLGIIFFTLQTPFSTVIVYRFKRSKYIIPLSIASLGCMYLFLLYFIPIFGVNGAAVSFALLNFLQLIFYVIYFNYLNKRRVVL